MKSDLPADVRLHRVAILGEWRRRLTACLERSGLSDCRLSGDLFPSFFEEVLALMEGRSDVAETDEGRPSLVGATTGFPISITVCLKLLNSGEATLRGFLLEQSSAFEGESEFDRACILWDLGRAFRILIHREIQSICRQPLHPFVQTGQRSEGGGDPGHLRAIH